MEIYERIKFLRKEELNLNQTDFGDKLGVSRSVIKNVELNALARPDQKLSLYKLICSTFGVREEWLLDGVGDMWVADDEYSLDEFAKTHGATDLELRIMKAYFALDEDIRTQALEHFKEYLAESKTPSIEDAEDEYIKSRLDSVQQEASSASNTIDDAINN